LLLLLSFLEANITFALSVAALDGGSAWSTFSRHLGNVGLMLFLFFLGLDFGDLVGGDNLIPIKVDVINFYISNLHEIVPVDAATT
jgi:hypothetical protein